MKGKEIKKEKLLEELIDLCRRISDLEKSGTEPLRPGRMVSARKICLPFASMFVVLFVLTWLNELLDIPHYLFGAPITCSNWQEALAETIVVVAVGCIAVLMLYRSIKKQRKAEHELDRYRAHLEELVEERTAELKSMVDAMALRVVRMSELEMAVRALRKQITDAGMTPVADDRRGAGS